ncbi:MAG: type II secretion system F family protein [Pirellulaceae bacterium]|nr:type II secretion system F family protein [Pirellulaceae bacterium]
MTLTATIAARPITLDQLVALCDEIAALSRAGVPLDQGLVALARELPGRVGTVAGEIGQRLAAGETLPQIIGQSSARLPPAFRAVLAAGERSGNLPDAVQDVARSARRISQMRATLAAALVYPLFVLLVIGVLLQFTLAKLLPVWLMMMVELKMIDAGWQSAGRELAASIGSWLFLVPLLLIAWFVWAWFRSGRVARGLALHPLLAWGAVGKLDQMRRASQTASLCELLALLIEHQVPLDEAVTLASAGVGSRAIERGGSELAGRIRRGQIGGVAPAGFPPLLAWTLVAGGGPGLAATLRRTAQVYRDDAARRGQWLAVNVPLATALLLGAAVALYAVLTLGPWIAMLHRLATQLGL